MCKQSFIVIYKNNMTEIIYPHSPSGNYQQFVRRKSRGFTLIELSLVLVIIGLIVGGVLVGRDLIAAAELRSQITQLVQYNTAVRTFQLKYGGLPGDLSADKVAAFGFTASTNRAGTQGEGDGDGLIWPYRYVSSNPATSNYQACCIAGEPAWFWEDLTTNSKMIEGSFTTAADVVYPYFIHDSTTSIKIQDIIPHGKIAGTYISVYTNNGFNYLSLLGFSQATNYLDLNGAISSTTPLSSFQAYSIDKKIDDGFPQTGFITAKYQNWFVTWNNGTYTSTNGVIWASGGMLEGVGDTSSTPASATTCYDNAGVLGTQQYSVGYNGGTGQNCAVSFKMQ